jgi:hypothetical protein
MIDVFPEEGGPATVMRLIWLIDLMVKEISGSTLY